jgi:ribonucleotide monophosphatase NagD (HAD superfamily)
MEIDSNLALRGILFDMDGVIYDDDRLIAGAAETIGGCRRTASPISF